MAITTQNPTKYELIETYLKIENYTPDIILEILNNIFPNFNEFKFLKNITKKNYKKNKFEFAKEFSGIIFDIDKQISIWKGSNKEDTYFIFRILCHKMLESINEDNYDELYLMIEQILTFKKIELKDIELILKNIYPKFYELEYINLLSIESYNSNKLEFTITLCQIIRQIDEKLSELKTDSNKKHAYFALRLLSVKIEEIIKPQIK